MFISYPSSEKLNLLQISREPLTRGVKKTNEQVFKKPFVVPLPITNGHQRNHAFTHLDIK